MLKEEHLIPKSPQHTFGLRVALTQTAPLLRTLQTIRVIKHDSAKATCRCQKLVEAWHVLLPLRSRLTQLL